MSDENYDMFDGEIEGSFDANKKKAEKLLNDADKLERFFQRLEKKLKKVPLVGDDLSNIVVLASLVKSYVKKEYTDVPIGTIISALGAVVYFVSPIDLIPDAVPVIGYLDDMAVIKFALTMIGDDVDEYRAWREKNGKKIDLED